MDITTQRNTQNLMNGCVRDINMEEYLNTSEALEAKRQAENGEYEVIGSIDDFKEYCNSILAHNK